MCHFVTWFESLRWTSVTASVTIVQAQVVFVTADAALFLSERVTARTVGETVVALCGIVVMSVGSLLDEGSAVGSVPLYKNVLAVIAAVCMEGYVLTRRSRMSN